MNVERLTAVRDRILAEPEKFNLAWWMCPSDASGFSTYYEDLIQADLTPAQLIHTCGTTACIAGHALAMFAPDEPLPERPAQSAADLLGLTEWQAATLFEPLPSFDLGGRKRYSITAQEAATAIDRLIATGDVDWSHVRDAAVEAE